MSRRAPNEAANDADGRLKRAIAGDADSLAALLEQFGPSVRARLKGRIAPHWQAVLDESDIMQVTYLEAFLDIRRFQPGGPNAFEAWLTRIARNNLQSAVRELARAKRPDPRRQLRARPGHDSRVTLLESLVGDETTPSMIVRRRESLDLLDAAVADLPADYQRVVRLCDLEGRPVAAVAAALGRSPGAVFMLRARAHDRLRTLLGPQLLSTISRVSEADE
jgi:RNA polymerase sigma-70 factor (ECF subfamily)